MPVQSYLAGIKQGSLSIVTPFQERNGICAWNCVCDCGREVKIRQHRLLAGQRACRSCVNTTHGRSYTQEYLLVVQARSRAKKYGIAFDLDTGDIHIPDVCPCLGIPLERRPKAKRKSHQEIRESKGLPKAEYTVTDSRASLDRIDPSKGYVKGNVWVISNRANTIKNNSLPPELRQIADAVEAKVKELNG